MYKNYKLSIITCVLNNKKDIQKNIASISKQTYNNYEHILVDGYSTDNSLDVIKKYINKNKKAKLFQLKPTGISDAMNYGITKSSGKYILIIHADDTLSDRFVLSNINDFINNNKKLDWFYGKINVIKNNKSIGIFPNRYIFQISNPTILKLFNYIPHQAVIITKNTLIKYKYFNNNYKCCMDYDFWLKICNNTNWKFFNHTISNFQIRKDSMSSSIKNQNKNQKEYRNLQIKYGNMLTKYVTIILNYIVQHSLNKNIFSNRIRK